MTQTQVRMADLYDRLVAAGFPKQFVRERILPYWWTDEADQDPDVALEGAMILANRLNVDVRSLLENNSESLFATTCQPKFKLKNGTDLQRLMVSQALASRVAELVAYSCKQPYVGLAGWTIEQIREQIWASREAVDLAGFLAFCWSIGIPVLHIANFPTRAHKFQGMVAYYGDRPVIILGYNHKSAARLLFIAAHELGHLLCRHIVPGDQPLIDEQVELATNDDEEAEANQVAAELLIGRDGISYDLLLKRLTGEQLAWQSRQLGQRDRVNAGVVALNISWNRAQRARTKKEAGIIWGVGSRALGLLEPDANAPRAINQVLCDQLDWECLGEEMADYLKSMLNLY